MITPLISFYQFENLVEVQGGVMRSIQLLPNIFVSLDAGWNLSSVQRALEAQSRPHQFSLICKPKDAVEVGSLVDYGVGHVILACDSIEDVEDLLVGNSSIPTERAGCLLDIDALEEQFRNHLPTILSMFSLVVLKSSGSARAPLKVKELLHAQKANYRGKWGFLQQSERYTEHLKGMGGDGVLCIVPADRLTLEADPEKIDLVDAILACLKSDRTDGLFPTCVVNEIGVTLGLAYSSSDSIRESLKTQRGVYHSRKHGMWHKGLTSGAFQNLKRISADCDSDTLCFSVYQHGSGFCHLGTSTCFGEAGGLVELEKTIWDRKFNAPEGSYTHRLFNDPDLLGQKLMEEAEELGDAKAPEEVAWEAADLIYFALVKCASFGVTLADVQNVLERKARKVTRRAGDAKPKWAGFRKASQHLPAPPCVPEIFKNRARAAASRFHLQTYRLSEISENERSGLLRRPILQSKEIFRRVEPILKEVRQRGDAALMAFTAKFDNVEVEDPTLVAPFPEDLMQLGEATRQAIDAAYARIHKFHAAQQEAEGSLEVETCPGVTCTRFSRPIQSVGLYVPGGTAVLPSTALMLGVPAMVAGCDKIVFATPPGPDGKVAPEVVYVAHKVGATHIVKAGGAQAIAALAYGTTKVPKVDKICGPGNQYVTGAKMLVQNDASAMVAIDMPAGPSEVLVIADTSSNPAFVASDLLSQAEHGPDSQCVLVTVGLDDAQIQAIMEAVASQAERLPRKDMVEKSLAQSFHLQADTLGEALAFSNDYAPEHLILQLDNPTLHLAKVQNAGSVFLGHYSPESCGDYASGTNHTLPTYGYARVHSGVSWATFRKFITSQHLTPEGLQGLGPVVETLARVEGLEAHAKAVSIRLQHLNSLP